VKWTPEDTFIFVWVFIVLWAMQFMTGGSIFSRSRRGLVYRKKSSNECETCLTKLTEQEIKKGPCHDGLVYCSKCKRESKCGCGKEKEI